MTKRLGSIFFAACLATATVLPASIAEAANTTYLKLKGAKQGDIKGSVTQKGLEGAIEVIAVSHEISVPTSVPGGKQVTGRRQHAPLVITKELDRSTPLLYKVMTTAERLSQVELTVYGPSEKGMSKPLYTVRLTDATISKIRAVTRGEGDAAREVSEVSFTYKTIEWTWNDGGITAMDDWEQPII
jgi:type VI secretion system secreted protein Hcp